MDASLKKILRALSLELRHILEGEYDEHGKWHPGDLECRLNEIGVWRDRSKPLDELAHLSVEDKAARKVVDAYLKLREDAGVERQEAVAEFVRESAYTWANRLFALRCMEARNIIEEVILQKDAYGGRSLIHNRFAKKHAQTCAGADDGLFAMLSAEFIERAKELPGLFNPAAPAVALRPSIAALKKCIALLSGRESVKGQPPAADAVFEAHDAFGWAYQYWNSEAKDRVFEKVRTEKGAKIEGADIIPATQLYTEPYMVKFLVQNSLGALWMGMHPDSKLFEQWEYYVRDADRATVEKKPVSEISMLDPALGSGHFHLESFDLFCAMYEEEGSLTTPEAIAASILNNNLFGIDIDERAIQIATAALWMKAKAKAPKLQPSDLTTFHDHLVATNIRLPKGKDHLEAFLKKHPDDAPLRSALMTVFDGLENAHEIGSLLQIEEPVEKALRDQLAMTPKVLKGGALVSVEKVDFQEWKREVISRLKEHFHAEAQAGDLSTAFFGLTAGKGLVMLDVLGRRYDVVTANPPYMGSKNMSAMLKAYVAAHYTAGKRDLYSAFILRCFDLAGPRGLFAMVTLGSWLTKDSFYQLRDALLTECHFAAVAFLARYAFSEVDPPGLPVLFACCKGSALINPKVLIFSISKPTETSTQASFLRRQVEESTGRVLEQRQLAALPGKQVLPGLTPNLLRLLVESRKLSSDVALCEPTTTGDNTRFVRFVWECPKADRWFLMSKGGGHRPWRGLEIYLVDWQHQGARIKAYPGSFVRNESQMFCAGLTFSAMSRHGISFRSMPTNMTFGKAGPGIFPPETELPSTLGFLNSRLCYYLLRKLNPGASISLGNIGRLPSAPKVECESLVNARLALAADRAATDLLEDCYNQKPEASGSTLASSSVHLLLEDALRSCLGLAIANELEQLLVDAAALDSESRELIVAELGTHPTQIRPLSGFNSIAEAGFRFPTYLTTVVQASENVASTSSSVATAEQFQESLRKHYEVGPEAEPDDESGEESLENDQDDDVEISAGLPAESFLEQLCRDVQANPISVVCLLKEGIEKEGWRCKSEEQRLISDRFTVITLRLLGHRWPKQIELNEPVPDWADNDGVIPVTEGTNEKTLLERVRQRITAEFPGGNVQSIENEFQEIMGESLAKWLPGSFFSRHISQFKKRPIAWQIETTHVRNHDDKARKKAARANAGPVFSCLVYYHKLDADLLPKIRTQYVGELITKYQTEERTLEKLALKTDEQDTRKWQLQNWIDELKAFDDRLNQIVTSGFATGSLRQHAIDDAMLQLKARWLDKLRDACQQKQLKSWQKLAEHDKIHDGLPDWIAEAITRLPRHCSAVGPEPPDEKKLKDDPTSADLAAIICVKPHKLVREALTLVCEDWWRKFDEIVLAPIKLQIKEARERLVVLEAELEQTDPPLTNLRKLEIAGELKPLKPRIKSLRENMEGLTESADKVRKQIIAWKCDDADDWEKWLAKQPLYDQISALNGEKTTPRTVADWIAQESLYAPDINDGVRVNIAPLQRAELLAADVLAGKDLDKAIADRAEWRADERRWAREGKLPQPGWWAD